MRLLDYQELIRVAERVLPVVEIRDPGLLESAAVRPRASVFGEDAYAGPHEKAAAMAHSLARNHALVDGNKRLTLASIIAVYGLNGMRLKIDNDEAHDLIVDIASGVLDEVADIAERLQRSVEPR